MPIVGDGHFGHRATLFAPIGQEFIESARIDHRARQNMRTDLRSFFEDADRNIRVELLNPDRRSQPGGAAADDYNVIGHRFTFTHLSLLRAIASDRLCDATI